MGYRWVVIGVVSLVILGGCAPKKLIKEEAISPQMEGRSADEPSLRGKEYQSIPELVNVYFDYDKAIIRSDAGETLANNAKYLTANPSREILVEGHCDERGTVEYNLALGQRRAQAVRDYYVKLGVAGSRIASISYGEEKPGCLEHNEGCWWQNRRGETRVRINPKEPPEQPVKK